MKTGNTCRWRDDGEEAAPASMEPGHEDREYTTSQLRMRIFSSGLNGARS